MGTIEKRGKDSWRVGVQVKTPAGWKWVRRTVHINPALSEARQRKEADKALLQLQLEVEQGELAPAGHDYTVRTWAEFWMEQHVKPECSPVTYAGYRYLLDSRILPLLGDIPLERLTPLRLTEWLNQVRESPRRSTRMDDEQLAHPRKPSAKLAPASAQKKPLSRKTVLHYYTCMESMLSAAVRLEVLDANPMDKVLRPKVKRPKINALSEERAVELLRCLADEPNMCYRAALLLALLCGLRLGEVGELKLSDVDWENATIDISRALKYTPQSGSFVGDPKTESSERPIALPRGMMDVLRSAAAYQEECRQLVPHLWVGQGWIVHAWNGAQLHHDTPSKWFRKFADRHGFEGVRFHDLRHTHASILLANNMDVVAVAHRMGHADASTTLRVYAHAYDSRDRDSARAMDRLLQQADQPDPAPPDLPPFSPNTPK